MKDDDQRLFPEGDSEEMNIRFFPGEHGTVAPEKFEEELEKADAQVRQGTAVVENLLDDELT